MTGLRLGVLNTETYTIIVLVAIVTSLMAPPILRYAMTRAEEVAEAELVLGDKHAGPARTAGRAGTTDPAPTPGRAPGGIRVSDQRGDS